MIPTLRTTIGVKGHRPLVGNSDHKDRVYLFGSINIISGKLTTNIFRISKRNQSKSNHKKLRNDMSSFQLAFARHIKKIAQSYKASDYDEVIVVMDNAPWHKSKEVAKLLLNFPHIKLYRLPSYSPQLNPIERFWKLIRRRATHNRFFESTQKLEGALRHSICYYQTFKKHIISMIGTAWDPVKNDF